MAKLLELSDLDTTLEVHLNRAIEVELRTYGEVQGIELTDDQALQVAETLLRAIDANRRHL